MLAKKENRNHKIQNVKHLPFQLSELSDSDIQIYLS